MSKPAITSMIMYDDSGLELDVSDVELVIYEIYTAYRVISVSLMRVKSTEEKPSTLHKSLRYVQVSGILLYPDTPAS